MSGRTQLLCTTFGIGCLWAYVAGARRWVVWGLFVAALLCKPMAVSLPFVMLAIDYFPLRRYEQLGWGRLVREKAVLIGLGAAAAAAAMITESQKGGLMIPLEKIPLSERVLLMFQSLVFYPWKLVWPAGLSPVYPLRLGISLGQPLAFASALCVGDCHSTERSPQATHAGAGGELGGVRHAGSSRVRTDANGHSVAARVSGDAAIAFAGGRSGGLGVAAFGDRRAGWACRPAGVRTVRIRITDPSSDTRLA